MAVAEATTHAELVTSEFIPELWSLKVQSFLEDALVIVPLVNHIYEADLRYGNVLHIPNYAEITATQVVPGTEITLKEPEGGTLEITVASWFEAPIGYSELSRIQNRPDFLDNATKGSAYAVAKQMDYSLAELFDDLYAGDAGSTAIGTDGAAITDDVLIQAMEILDEADVPQNDRFLVINPSCKADMMKIDKFVRNDYTKGGVIPTGKFGDVYNCGVFVTNNLVDISAGSGQYACMFQREALAIITQKKPTVVKFSMPWKHMEVANVTAVWGVAEMRDTAGVPIKTRSKAS